MGYPYLSLLTAAGVFSEHNWGPCVVDLASVEAALTDERVSVRDSILRAAAQSWSAVAVDPYPIAYENVSSAPVEPASDSAQGVETVVHSYAATKEEAVQVAFDEATQKMAYADAAKEKGYYYYSDR